MSRFVYQGVMQDGNGARIEGGAVSALLADTATAATIYVAKTGGAPVASVVTASDGAFSFYIEELDYVGVQLFDVTMTKSGYQTKTLEDIDILGRSDGQAIDVRWFGAKGDGSDEKIALLLFVDYMNSNGGVAVFPYTGSGYATSEELAFTRSNITLLIEDDITNLKTTKSSLLTFKGTSSVDMIENIIVLGRSNPNLDGNGSNITGYVYDLGDTNYGTVFIEHVSNYRFEGVTCDNGLVGSFKARRCRGGLVSFCIFSGAVHDNGLGITRDLSTYSATDPDTWASVRVTNCIAFDNEDFGFASFDGTEVTFENCVAYHNGTLLSSLLTPGGGGFSYETDQADPLGKTDYLGRFVNCHSMHNITNGFFITASGVIVDDNCKSKGTTVTWAGSNPEFYGNSVRLIAVKRVVVNGTHEESDGFGIHALGSNIGDSQFLDITIGANLFNNTKSGLHAQGVEHLEITQQARITGNGTASPFFNGVNIQNSSAAFNQGSGTLVVDGGFYNDNGHRALLVNGVGKAIATDLNGSNNLAGVSGPAVQFLDVGDVQASKIFMTEDSGNQTFVVFADSACDNALVWDIHGDFTTALQSNDATTKRWIAEGVLTVNTAPVTDIPTAQTAITLLETRLNALLSRFNDAGVLEKI